VTGDADDGEERGVEAQFAACESCFGELMKTIKISSLLYEAAAVAASQEFTE
jgi:hypothetical protein